MGVYCYKTSPAKVATVVAQDLAGKEFTVDVNLYAFAYKCYRMEEDARTYSRIVGPAETAFKRKGTKPLAHGITVYEGATDVGAPVFLTHGHVGMIEPGEARNSVIGRVVRVIRGVKLTKPTPRPAAPSPAGELLSRINRNEMVQAVDGAGRQCSLWKQGTEYTMVKQGSDSHSLDVGSTNAERLLAHWQGFTR